MINATEFDVNKWRAEFPGLQQRVHDKPLIYFDNAATTQKPLSVIEAVKYHYEFNNANVHRGLHTLSDRATNALENARQQVAHFIQAKSLQEVIFTRGTTESINLVAHSYAMPFLSPTAEIVITTMEHHANIVPWQMVCQRVGCRLRVARLTEAGDIDQEHFRSLLNERTQLVAFPHISNALGTINPITDLIATVRELTPAVILVDGAQAVAHMPINVSNLDCDFYAFSSHKLYGPSGVGVLYGKEALLERMIPYQAGGEMIHTVSFENTEFNVLPYKFEAGTPNIEGAVGLQAAILFLQSLGFVNIQHQEHALAKYLDEQIKKVAGIRLLAAPVAKAAITTFVADEVSAHDIGTLLDLSGIAIRVGHHCTMPLHAALGINASARASLAFYNTHDEIDEFIRALTNALRILRGA